MSRNLSRKQKKAAAKRWQRWVTENREKHNAAVRKYRHKRYAENNHWLEEGPKAKALKKWYEHLKSKPCTDCGHRFLTCCMDFDHRIRNEKEILYWVYGCSPQQHGIDSQGISEVRFSLCQLSSHSNERPTNRKAIGGDRMIEISFTPFPKIG